jgi:hypothetical protein
VSRVSGSGVSEAAAIGRKGGRLTRGRRFHTRPPEVVVVGGFTLGGPPSGGRPSGLRRIDGLRRELGLHHRHLPLHLPFLAQWQHTLRRKLELLLHSAVWRFTLHLSSPLHIYESRFLRPIPPPPACQFNSCMNRSNICALTLVMLDPFSPVDRSRSRGHDSLPTRCRTNDR